MSDAVSTTDAIHALWDALADIEISRVEHARNRLLEGLCALVDAQNASWVGAVRMDHAQPGDPVSGWRVRISHRLHDNDTLHSAVREQTQNLDAGSVDLSTIRNVSFAGTWRTRRLVDLVPPAWFEGDYYRNYYRGLGWLDAIWAGVPINRDTEIYFGLYRGLGQPWFSEAERDIVAHALRGLRWFHRQQTLGHGLGIGVTPLTELERRVLSGLLEGLTDKQIAARLEMSTHTTHEYASRIYRKFAVPNRSSLMALWLGRPVAD
ncbi:MAG: helix-turn-helix transcriptional regulator [Pseudomonadota bacterium]|nr:helix-turn-helix transcriptional regulator [Pseudomonadota bacterium]